MKLTKGVMVLAAFVSALAVAGSPGSAATTPYSVATDFATALNGSSRYTEAFTNLSASPGSPFNSATTYGYKFVVGPASGGLKRTTTGPTGLSANTAGKSLTLTFPLGGVKAFAARFFLTTNLGALRTGVTNGITVTLDDGTTSTFTPDSASFRGFISTSNITTVTVTTPASSANYVTIDDVTLSNNDPPVAVALTAFPTSARLNMTLPVYPEATVKNASNATLTSYYGPVSIAIMPNTGTTGATLTGTRTVNAVAGIATFDNLQIDKTGIGYQLAATAGTATSDSAPLNVALATYDYATTLTSPTSSGDNTVYFGDAAGIVHAVNTLTGSVVFDTDITGGGPGLDNPDRKPLGSLTRWMLAGQPRIFCVTSDNYLMVFDINGNPVWTAALAGNGTSVNASAMVYNDGTADCVYVATSNGTDTIVSKVSADGTQVLSSLPFSGATSTSTVSVFGGSVYFSTPVGSFRLAASDLSVLNMFGAGTGSTAPPFIAATNRTPIAIIVTTGGIVSAYSATTGGIIHGFGNAGTVDLGVGGSDPKVTAAPFVYGDKVYVAGMDNKLYCVSLADGSAAGLGGTTAFFDASIAGAGSITTGIGVCPYGAKSIVFGSTNGRYYSVNLTQGGASIANIGSPINSAPAYDPITKTICIAADNGNMYQMPAVMPIVG